MLVDKYDPKDLDSLIGRAEVVSFVKKSLVDTGGIPNLMFIGPPGVGKTTIAYAIRNTMYGKQYQHMFYELNASHENGVDVIRDKVSNWTRLAIPEVNGKKQHRIIFLDEADGLTKEAQRALKRVMEDHSDICRFIIAANRDSSIEDAIKSRCLYFKFDPIQPDLLLKYLVWIVKQEGHKVDVPQLKVITKISRGDLRNALTMLDGYIAGKVFREVADGSILNQKFEAIRKMSYEFDVRYLFNLLDNELSQLYAQGTDIRRAVLVMSDYEARASMATIGAIHFQAAVLKIKQTLASKA
jgi:replication factor C small subunit